MLENLSKIFFKWSVLAENSRQHDWVQKRALRIVFPDKSFSKAMQMAGLTALKERRERLCIKYVDRLQDHSLSLLLLKVEQVDHGYHLRVKKPTRILYGDRKVCRTERSSQFLTFKF